MIPKPERTSIKTIDKKLWKLFSIYIRLTETKDGWGRCVSCGKPRPFKLLDAGHYFSRGSKYLRIKFDPMNVHIQCKHCNGFIGGNIPGYRKWMIEKYGPDFENTLLIKNKTNPKPDRLWYVVAIEYYKDKIELLRSNDIL